MKVLFCLGSFTHGRAERVISNLSQSFSKEHDLSIILTKKSNLSYPLPPLNLNYLDDDSKKNNIIIKNIKRLFKMNKLIKEIKPDIIISFLPEPSYRVLLLKIFNRIPVIVSVRNDPKVEYKSKINYLLMRFLYPKADGFVFQTKEAKKYFPKVIQEKSKIILNPLSQDFIKNEIITKRKKRIVNVGRLVPQKNHYILIDAISKLPKKFDDYVLCIYGVGPLKDELLSYIKKLNLEKRVFLMGEIDNVQEEIKDASLFVLSSNYEGLPNSLIEAMALGLPVISTDCPCGGPSTLIKNNINGILVPVNDSITLTNEIKRVLNDSNLASKLGHEAKKIIDYTHPDKINEEWLNYIEKILKNGS